MSTNKMDSSTVYGMFEEIKQHIKESGNKNPYITNPVDLSIIENKVEQSGKTILMKLDKMSQNVSNPVEQKHHHKISIDITSSWVFIALISLSVFLICSIGFNISQQHKNRQLKNSDLKYRYIRMANGIDSENLILLENIFINPDNKKMINKIRKDVEIYEQKIKEQAEKLQQMNRDNNDIQQLQREIEALKNGK